MAFTKPIVMQSAAVTVFLGGVVMVFGARYHAGLVCLVAGIALLWCGGIGSSWRSRKRTRVIVHRNA